MARCELEFRHLGAVAWVVPVAPAHPPPVGAMLERMPRIVRTGYVLLVVLIGWVFFRAPNLEYATVLSRRACSPSSSQGQALLRAFDLVTVHSLTVIATAFVFSLPLWPMLRSRLAPTPRSPRAMPATPPRPMWPLVMILSFAAMAGDENSPFLYFRF